MTSSKTLIIIYNADSTIRGKLQYAYRKLSSSSPDPACAACDITHGGLSLSEVPGWKNAKSDIEARGWKVIQWHRDEIEPEIKSWIQKEKIRYPTVLVKGQTDVTDTRQVMDSAELAECAGDAMKMVETLKKKAVLADGVQHSSL
ncbi:hypothetical protein B0A50_00926 [Salinomyces thailandicus]|uniref:Uncharacterized protein n=1 Tax=Salinomyces thailandicus TaxID=706561 RepID=A0A4U0UD51_9PEZI|nr:hypothetical protein B0A50_00926 [Salinomyces thailandica]